MIEADAVSLELPCVDENDFRCYANQGIVLVDGTNTIPLLNIGALAFRTQYPKPSEMPAGKPLFYHIFANSIYFAPMSDDTYNLNEYWYRWPSRLDGSEDRPLITVVDDALVYFAAAIVLQQQEDFNRATALENLGMQALTAAMKADDLMPDLFMEKNATGGNHISLYNPYVPFARS